MIGDLKPYPEYRDENISWAHRLPAHWGIKRGKALFAESLFPVREEDEIVTCFRDGQVTLRKNRRTTGFMFALYEAGYQGVRKGQLVIHAMDAFAGAIGVSDSDGKCTPEYIVTNPRSEGIVPQYYALLLRYIAHQGFILISCPAVRERAPRFRYPNFGDMPLMVPPPEEQAVIVRFLGDANGRLERAIRAKRKVIALLNEQKQAIIHRAVTRGLDPSAPLKPSAIPWLGDIPAHWKLHPNRAHLRLRKQLVGENSSKHTLLSLTLRGVIARDMENRSGKWPAEFNAYQVVKAGNLVFCLFDVDETPRCVGLSRLNGMITGAYTVFELADPSVADWLYFYYLAMDNQKALKPTYTGLRKVIQKGVFLGLKSPIPPENERGVVVRHILKAQAEIDTVITRLEREIALLREYRTRLVADVVTGQLDVRSAAAHLPFEVSAPAATLDASSIAEPTEELDEGE